MDYTRQPFLFRLKKAARYVRLYGVRRTLVKVRGQYHIRKVYESRPAERLPSNKAHVGMIGCGNFAFSCLAYYLKKNFGQVIRGTMDVDINRAASLFERYGAAYYTDDPSRVTTDPDIDLVYIASNHASHAEYAIDALNQGKSVHIEKPHVVTRDQLVRLCRTMTETDGRVGLGFNRPESKFGREILRSLSEQDGAGMYNWFLAGHKIDPDHWYFKEEEGGRILGNLCHWTDFVYHLVPEQGRYPIVVTPTRYEKADSDIAVTYLFGDGTIAAITFSAKGHTFEGVKERFAGHKGNALIALDDFKTLTIEVVDDKRKVSGMFRDHGHEAAVKRSYALSKSLVDASAKEATIKYVWETGDLFLKTKEALDARQQLTIDAYDPVLLTQPVA